MPAAADNPSPSSTEDTTGAAANGQIAAASAASRPLGSIVTGQPKDAPHDAYAALRSKNYILFASGFICSSTGLQMLGTAIGWDIYEKTHDPLALGYVGLARALPVILLSLPAGQAIDILNRKKVLIVTQLAFAALIALLAFQSRSGASLWFMYVLLVLTGCARSFNGPSRASLLPSLIPEGTFQNAVAWQSGAFQFAAMVGPLIAGWIIAQTHAAWPVYGVTSALCFVFAFSAMFLNPRPQKLSKSRVTLGSVVAGMGHVYREKTILSTLALDLFAVLLGGATALMPAYAKDILHVSPIGLGWLRSAPFIGALVMGLVMAHRPPLRNAGPMLLWSVFGFGLCTIGFGFSTNFWLSMGLLIVLGGLDNISVIVRHVLVQLRTPEDLRGRVSSVNTIFIESSNELGAFESGVVARLAEGWAPIAAIGMSGVVFSVVTGGVGTILVVGAVAMIWPEIRRLRRLDPLPDIDTEATQAK